MGQVLNWYLNEGVPGGKIITILLLTVDNGFLCLP